MGGGSDSGATVDVAAVSDVDSGGVAADVAGQDSGGSDLGATSDGGQAGACVCPPSMDKACSVGVCDPKTGTCSEVARNQSGPCEDGDPCTVFDSCDAGSCVAGIGDACDCHADADCAGADADLCLGKAFCSKEVYPWSCKVVPGTAVLCALDSAKAACNVSSCEPKTGTCSTTALAKAAPCDDGDACTANDSCDAGACKAGTQICACSADADCAAKEDGDPCNGTLYCDAKSGTCQLNPASIVTCPTAGEGPCVANSCVKATGLCQLHAKAAGTGCDDGEACTAGDICSGGVCKPGTNLCACKGDADCAAKDDGDQCNGKLYCQVSKGSCEVNPASVVVCPTVDDSACAKNTCQPKTGACALAVAATNTACEDGSACTVGDVCDGGVCQPGTDVCPCSSDAQCEATLGDGDLCNGVLFCNKQSGKCQPNAASAVTCKTVDDTECVKATCDPKVGVCKPKSVADGSKCDDGDVCTKAEICSAGLCQGGVVTCACKVHADCDSKDDGDRCNGTYFCDKSGPAAECKFNPASVVYCPPGAASCVTNVCNQATGACQLQPSTDGVPCSDSGKCAKSAACKNGVCAVQQAVDCDDADVCTTDSCDPKVGCVHTKSNCNDGNSCTSDACDPKTGACAFASAGQDGKTCNGDDTGCTVNDTCKAGVCTIGIAVVCKIPLLACEQAVCASNGPAGFQCLALPKADGDACDDGDACTLASACSGGTCKGSKEALIHDFSQPQVDVFGHAEFTAVARFDDRLLLGGRAWHGDADSPKLSGGFLRALAPNGDIAWTHVLASPVAGKGLGVVAVEHHGGGVYSALRGQAAGSPVQRTAIVSLFTDEGGAIQIIGQKVYGDPQVDLEPRALVGNFDLGHTALLHLEVGGKARARLLRAVGKTLVDAWQLDLSGDTARAGQGLAAAGEGGVVVAGWIAEQDGKKRGWLAAVDGKGKAQWQRTYGKPGLGGLRAVHLLPASQGGGYVLGGSIENDPLAPTQLGPWGLRVDASGKQLLELVAPLAGAVWDAKPGADGEIRLAATVQLPQLSKPSGQMYVFDGLGNLQASHFGAQWGGAGRAESYQALAVQAGGGMVVVGSSEGADGVRRPLLVRTDAFGHASCKGAGVCAGKPFAACIDGNPCTADACDPQKGCSPAPSPGMVCVPGDGCHLDGACQAGACKPGKRARLYSGALDVVLGSLAGVVGLQDGASAIAGRTANKHSVVLGVSAAGELAWTRPLLPLHQGADLTGAGPVALRAAASGGLWLAINEAEATIGRYARLLRLGPLGDVSGSWPAKAPSNQGAAHDVDLAANGDVLLLDFESGLRLHRFLAAAFDAGLSQTPTPVWTSGLGAETASGRARVRGLPDGGALLVSALAGAPGAHANTLWFGRVAPTGKLALKSTLQPAAKVEIGGATLRPDGTLLLVGAALGPPNRPFVAAISLEGTLLWSRLDPPAEGYRGVVWSEGRAVAATRVESLLVGSLLARPLAHNGLIQATWKVSSAGASLQSATQDAIARLDDGGVILAGLADDGAVLRPWVARADGHGHFGCAAAGTCATLAADACDDGNACTFESCDPVKGCSHTPAADGAGCGGTKVCLTGVCVAPPAPGMILIPAGKAWMGCDPERSSDCHVTQLPYHEITTSAYWIDRDEVTMSAYAHCMAVSACYQPWAGVGCVAQNPAKDNYQALNCTGLAHAKGYCGLRGARLPTEAEWEKAARGGCELYGEACKQNTPIYPWGAAPPTCALTMMTDPANGQAACGAEGNLKTAAVGSRPSDISPYGLRDVAGNLGELVLDTYDPLFYWSKQATALDPVFTGTSDYQVVRGGDWTRSAATAFRLHERRVVPYNNYETGHFDLGFRCVVPVPK